MVRTLLAIVLANTLVAGPLWAVDYDKIERSIVKEPMYRTGKPEYALLVFGPEARHRIWIVADGDTIYLDRNRDGDLTKADERFENGNDHRNIEFSEPDGKTRYVITRLRVDRDSDMKRPTSALVWIEIHGPLDYQQYSFPELGTSPGEAPVVHFHGPLTIGPCTSNGKVPPDTVLTTGDKPGELQAFVGTISERHKCWVAVVSHTSPTVCSFADGVRPKLTIEFPQQDPNAPPITEQYSLDEFC